MHIKKTRFNLIHHRSGISLVLNAQYMERIIVVQHVVSFEMFSSPTSCVSNMGDHKSDYFDIKADNVASINHITYTRNAYLLLLKLIITK